MAYITKHPAADLHNARIERKSTLHMSQKKVTITVYCEAVSCLGETLATFDTITETNAKMKHFIKSYDGWNTE